MIMIISEFLGTLGASIIRAVTGALYTDEQIKSITKGAVGKYLKEFFPPSQDELNAQNRVAYARDHIEAASAIIRDMQEDLESQESQLNSLLDSINEKKKLADRYQTLAETNREAFNAFRIEMEEALKRELIEQENKGKRMRQITSILMWLITLFSGAALGHYFEDLIDFFNLV